MKVTPLILQHEFVGLRARVVRSSNPSCVGVSGIVLHDTRNTLMIGSEEEEKTVAKKSSVFRFIFPSKQVIDIDGKALVGRPEDRVKRIIRRIW